MIPARQALARAAIRAALSTRAKLGVSAGSPVSVYDAAERLGVEMRFLDLPSMEGMYDATSKTIVVSSLRPPGRQTFTAAHELGHHVHRHGHRIDQLLEEKGSQPLRPATFIPEEFVADCFAGAFLMPKSTVLRGFADRGWMPANCGPNEIYILAGWLGVGYTTLLHHLCRALSLLSEQRFSELFKSRNRLATVRRHLSGAPCPNHLVVVDTSWCDRAVDISVGDVVRFPRAEVEGTAIEVVRSEVDCLVVIGRRPGIARVVGGGWAHFVRVSRAQYVGRAKFRFEEEVEDGD